jgi:hypothetical protein
VSAERPVAPAVVVRYAGGHPEVLRQVCAGLEEEGVPARVEPATDPPGCVALAHAAARASPLETGIGIDAAGAVAVHHAALPRTAPVRVLRAGAAAAEHRLAGGAAARVVTVQPLR